MSHDSDLTPEALDGLQRIDGDMERVGIECAEAFVDEKRVGKRMAPVDSREASGRSAFLPHLAIDHIKRQIAFAAFARR